MSGPSSDAAEAAAERISPVSGGRVPLHVGVIMDGNGRWAKQRGLPRVAGHRAGSENIRRVIERFADHGVLYLTLYAFSTENWNRPQPEVQALVRLLSRFLKKELDNLDRNGVCLRLLGHTETLPKRLQREVEAAIARTADNGRLTLNLCFSYGGRDDIVCAVRALMAEGLKAEDVDEAAIARHLSTAGMPEPGLVIRTGGDVRISNFLVWESTYAELYFTETYWPDFGLNEIDAALAEYARRQRKFGGLLPEDAAALAATALRGA